MRLAAAEAEVRPRSAVQSNEVRDSKLFFTARIFSGISS